MSKWILLLLAPSAFADVSIGVGLGVPEDSQLETATVYDLRVEHRGLYVFGSYTDPKLRKVGQTMHSLDVVGYGIGGLWSPRQNIFLSLAVGWYEPDLDPDSGPRNEAVLRTLVNNHGQPSFHPTEFSYEIDGDWGVTIGGEWRRDHLGVFVEYRALKFPEFMEMWTGQRHDLRSDEPDCRCWWQHGSTLDASMFLVGVRYTF